MAPRTAGRSMGPKVEAACGFVTATGNDAVIGSLADIADIVAGMAGTRVRAAGWSSASSAG